MSNYTKEQILRVIRDKCSIGKTDIQLAINNAMKLNKGIIMNINGEQMITSNWLYNTDNQGDEFIYVDVDENNNYVFFLKEKVENTVVTRNIPSLDVVGKALEYFHNLYGRDVSLEFVMHYEVGTMIVVPDKDKLTEEEFKGVFKRSISYQSQLMSNILENVETTTNETMNPVTRTYGKDFFTLCRRFNLPLWVIIADNLDPFKRLKLDIMKNLQDDLSERLLQIKERTGDIDVFAEMSLVSFPKSNYKIPIGHDRSKVRKELAGWEYLPMTTTEILGVRNLRELVDKYLFYDKQEG